MSAFLVLVRLRLLDVTRSKSMFLFFVLLPLVLLCVVAGVFAEGHPFERKQVLVVESQGHAGVLRALAKAPEVRPERIADAAHGRTALRTRVASAVVLFESDGNVRLLVAPYDGLFGKGLASLLESEGAVVVVETVGVPRWGYVHYLFPGLLTFTVLLAGLFGMGSAMVRYRENLFLKKLATTPLRRSTFVAAQLSARGLLVLAQVTLMIAAAWGFFDITLTARSAAWLMVITVLGLLTFTGAGFVLACVFRTETLVVDTISAATTPLVLFSEIFFPLDDLPRLLAQSCVLLPSTQMVRLVRAVLLYGETDLLRLAPGLAILGAWTVVTYGTSLLSFKWHR